MGYRKRGDSYEVNVAYKGSRLFATVASETEAKEKVVELKAELIRKNREKTGEPVLPSGVHIPITVAETWTLEEAIKVAFETRWEGRKSERFYREKTKGLVAYFKAGTRLGDIKTTQVDAFKKTFEKRELSQAYMNHHLTALSMIFKIAQERGGVNHRPTFGIKQNTRGRIRWMEEDEEAWMLQLFDQWAMPDMHDWTCVLVDTGMRPSETKDMTGQWCDFRTSTIHVHESKTEAGVRAVPMTKRVKVILERRCLKHTKGSLFPYIWRNYQRAWESASKKMGLHGDQDFVPYCLRHTFATRLVQRGVHLEVIAKLMGHANLDQTRVYAKLASAQFVDAISHLEKEPVAK